MELYVHQLNYRKRDPPSLYEAQGFHVGSMGLSFAHIFHVLNRDFQVHNPET